ncbi:hypothetical protein [Streptococcus thoraltensis]|uniref:hypothetical protein n=1 Tax=Streptococcus thoraltensis TaxID=55085 RepID=UPI00037D69E2|nr:hypothetical protein [Streptococcus thoraltensis]MDY4761359.1 hypothetical protein [Streptococcus thoraltensis]
MSHQSVIERLSELRQKYIEQPSQNDSHFVDSPQMTKMKKKLIALEKERCYLKMAQKDCKAVDQKIADLKESFAEKHEGG